MQKWFKYGRGAKLQDNEVSVTKGAFVYMTNGTRMKYLPKEYAVLFFDVENCLAGLQTSDDRYDGFKINLTNEAKRKACARVVLKQANKTMRMAAGRYSTVWNQEEKILVWKYNPISPEKEAVGEKGKLAHVNNGEK